MLTSELVAKLTVLSFLLVTLVPPLVQLGNAYASAKSIEAYVNKIIHLSNVKYSEGVLMSRCLKQTQLSMSDINLDSQVNAITYSTEYVQNSAFSNAKPTAIKIKAQFNDVSELTRVSRFLESNEQTNNALIFYSPLNYKLPDWQQLNITTGCIK